MPENFTLRLSNPQDKADIEALFIEMLRSIYHTDEVKGYPEGYLDKFYAGTGDRIVVAESDGQIVGYLSIEEHHEAEDFLYLDDCSVKRDYRGRGIGTALFAAAEQYARSRSIPAIYLHVEKENTRAIKFYRNLGYETHREEGSRYRMVYRLQFITASPIQQ